MMMEAELGCLRQSVGRGKCSRDGGQKGGCAVDRVKRLGSECTWTRMGRRISAYQIATSQTVEESGKEKVRGGMSFPQIQIIF